MATEQAPANSASFDAGSDRAEPSDALDSPDNLNFWEPSDDDEPTLEAEGEGIDPDSETDEPEDGQEADDPEAAGDDTDDGEGDDSEDAAQPEPTDDVTVTVNGEKLALSELKSGYMRQGDYSRKTQELSQQRNDLTAKRTDLEALSSRVATSVNAIAELLTASVPKRPDDALAISDPQRHYKEMTLHNSAMAKVAEVISKANEPKEALNQLTNEQRAELIQSENAKLMEAFPQTNTPEGRKKFFETTASVARELGYTDAEIAQATDHRMFKLAHYARIGMQAEAARTKAKAKVTNVPPVAPNKRQPSANASKIAKNREAMKRLGQTGSMADAMAIDFD